MDSPTEELLVASFVEDVLSCYESMPGDVQLLLSRYRELDVQVSAVCSEVERTAKATSLGSRPPSLLTHDLLHLQDLQDQKLRLLSSIQELLDQKRVQLDASSKLFKDRQKATRKREASQTSVESRRSSTASVTPKKKKTEEVKRRKSRATEAKTKADPDEDRFCICRNVSYGDMIACDNDQCSVEWFHFRCVKLTAKPRGKWFCPNCRADKSSIKRADL